jgi:hypothetical protein
LLCACASVAIAFLARLALTPILGDASPYLLFVPADLVAGGLGGLGPGLLLAGLQSAAAVSDPASRRLRGLEPYQSGTPNSAACCCTHAAIWGRGCKQQQQ